MFDVCAMIANDTATEMELLMVDTTIIIPAQFNGPPTSGNGGFCAGRVARFIDGDASVSLHAPPPLDTPLDVTVADGRVDVRHGDKLVMSAISGGPILTPPPAPAMQLARQGAAHFIAPDKHPFPRCFVCGPDRGIGDGLRIFTGRPDGSDHALDIWTPLADFTDETGTLPDEIIWAALDCPSAFAIRKAGNTVLLGKFSAKIITRPNVGEDYITAGWEDHSVGRKHFCGTAIFDKNGELMAHADALWIELRGQS